MMVEADLELANKEKILLDAGYRNFKKPHNMKQGLQ
jgi:hypothetical protein